MACQGPPLNDSPLLLPAPQIPLGPSGRTSAYVMARQGIPLGLGTGWTGAGADKAAAGTLPVPGPVSSASRRKRGVRRGLDCTRRRQAQPRQAQKARPWVLMRCC